MMFRLIIVAALMVMAMGALFFAVPTQANAEALSRSPTHIAPQELAQALHTLAKDRDVQLVYRSDIVGDRLTQGASGVLTLDEALTQLLRGTGLVYRYLGEGAITIVRGEPQNLTRPGIHFSERDAL